jgi:hypothetical protein
MREMKIIDISVIICQSVPWNAAPLWHSHHLFVCLSCLISIIVIVHQQRRDQSSDVNSGTLVLKVLA